MATWASREEHWFRLRSKAFCVLGCAARIGRWPMMAYMFAGAFACVDEPSRQDVQPDVPKVTVQPFEVSSLNTDFPIGVFSTGSCRIEDYAIEVDIDRLVIQHRSFSNYQGPRVISGLGVGLAGYSGKPQDGIWIIYEADSGIYPLNATTRPGDRLAFEAIKLHINKKPSVDLKQRWLVFEILEFIPPEPGADGGGKSGVEYAHSPHDVFSR